MPTLSSRCVRASSGGQEWCVRQHRNAGTDEESPSSPPRPATVCLRYEGRRMGEFRCLHKNESRRTQRFTAATRRPSICRDDDFLGKLLRVSRHLCLAQGRRGVATRWKRQGTVARHGFNVVGGTGDHIVQPLPRTAAELIAPFHGVGLVGGIGESPPPGRWFVFIIMFPSFFLCPRGLVRKAVVFDLSFLGASDSALGRHNPVRRSDPKRSGKVKIFCEVANPNGIVFLSLCGFGSGGYYTMGEQSGRPTTFARLHRATVGSGVCRTRATAP